MYRLIVHGGAGLRSPETFDRDREADARKALQHILMLGQQMLESNATAIDVVTHMVSMMEDTPLFNAGRGSVLASNGQCYFDASIMDGATESIGSVGAVQNVQHPIQLAKSVMTDSPYVMLVGKDAYNFAQDLGLSTQESEWFVTPYRTNQLITAKQTDCIILDHESPEDPVKGTVGAVALDIFGNLAAATSTGGMCNKRTGRVGDAGIIGAGTYARNQTCAVSCTGHGERFIQHHVAGRLSNIIEFTNLSLKEASHRIIHTELPADSGGLIAIGSDGTIVAPFNTGGMFHGWLDDSGQIQIRIWQHECQINSQQNLASPNNKDTL